jgi:hypothetical protein
MNQNLTLLTVLFLLFLTVDANAQKTLSELPPAHASALQQFLTKHDGLEFLSETVCDQAILKDMRKNFGTRFTPYYRTGDFNRDGVPDFAMILAKQGGPIGDQGSDISETHRYLYDLTIVIFNGRRGTYTPVFVKTTKAPLVSFLNLTFEKKRRLTFGVYETDDGFIMTPAGKGYIIEYGDK